MFYHFYTENFVIVIPVERATEKENKFVIYCPFKYYTKDVYWNTILKQFMDRYIATKSKDFSISLYFSQIKLLERSPIELVTEKILA